MNYKKTLSHSGIRIRYLQLAKRTRYHCAPKSDMCRVVKTLPGFTCAIFRNLPIARGICSKLICRLFLSYNICIVLLFDKLRRLDSKAFTKCNSQQIILLHLPR